MNIADIRPYEKNAKKHPDDQLRKIANSLKEFGWQQPIVVNKDGVIIVGHGRYMAYTKYPEGIKEPKIEVADLTEEQEKAYRLADNKLNESDWDMSLAVSDLKELSESMQEITGFDLDILIEGNEKDDEVPEVPVEPKSKLGDLYELGNHRVLCGDSTMIDDIEKLCNGNKVDMYLTDPPYNVNYEGSSGLKIENDNMEDAEFRSFLKDAFIGADTVMKCGAVFYIWYADSEGYNFRGACHDIGWQVRQCLIWNKNSMVMGRQDYHWKHEPCLYGWKDGASHLWNSDRTQTTILNFDRPTKSLNHPTMKPLDLFAYQITNNTKGEDIILDSFLGSGTTLIACQKTGRTCYGMELDPKYVDVIVQRYVDYTGNRNIKRNGEDIVW